MFVDWRQFRTGQQCAESLLPMELPGSLRAELSGARQAALNFYSPLNEPAGSGVRVVFLGPDFKELPQKYPKRSV